METLPDGIAVHIMPRRGFRPSSQLFTVVFTEDTVGKLLYEDRGVRVGMFAKCTRRDVDVQIKVFNRDTMTYKDVVPKLGEKSIINYGYGSTNLEGGLI